MSMLRITWVRSAIGYPQDQRGALRTLGLHRLQQSVVRPESPGLLGALKKIHHLLRVEKLTDEGA